MPSETTYFCKRCRAQSISPVFLKKLYISEDWSAQFDSDHNNEQCLELCEDCRNDCIELLTTFGYEKKKPVKTFTDKLAGVFRSNGSPWVG